MNAIASNFVYFGIHFRFLVQSGNEFLSKEVTVFSGREKQGVNHHAGEFWSHVAHSVEASHLSHMSKNMAQQVSGRLGRQMSIIGLRNGVQQINQRLRNILNFFLQGQKVLLQEIFQLGLLGHVTDIAKPLKNHQRVQLGSH